MEGGERRKRKMNSQEEKDDDEEEKMKKFFALIKSTREVRDRLRNNNNNSNSKIEPNQEQKQERKFDIVLGQKPAGIWNPIFQPEDFLGGIDNYNNNISKITPGGGGVGNEAGPSKRENHDQEDNNKQQDHKEGNGLELDLKLSL